MLPVLLSPFLLWWFFEVFITLPPIYLLAELDGSDSANHDSHLSRDCLLFELNIVVFIVAVYESGPVPHKFATQDGNFTSSLKLVAVFLHRIWGPPIECVVISIAVR
jgi:hypothetical protein